MVHFPGKESDFLKVGALAAGRGDVELMREILKARPKWIQHVGSHGRTLLWEASHKGKLAMVKYLVRRKSNIDACGTHYTPYFVEISCYCIARHKKHHEVADYLLSKGAAQDIHTAAFLSDVDALREYLKKDRKLLNASHLQYEMSESSSDDPPFVLKPAKWATPLCYALRGGDLETVKFLISRKARIKGNEREYFIAAAEEPERIELLLQNGADPAMLPDIHPDQGRLYEIASAYGAEPDSNSLNEELVYLCRGDRGGNTKEVQRLLSLGANVNHQDKKGKTATHRASKAGFTATLKVLLDAGADVDLADIKGETALFEIARSTIKDVKSLGECLTLLLGADANPVHLNSAGKTAIEIASRAKRKEIRRLSRQMSASAR